MVSLPHAQHALATSTSTVPGGIKGSSPGAADACNRRVPVGVGIYARVAFARGIQAEGSRVEFGQLFSDHFLREGIKFTSLLAPKPMPASNLLKNDALTSTDSWLE